MAPGPAIVRIGTMTRYFRAAMFSVFVIAAGVNGAYAADKPAEQSAGPAKAAAPAPQAPSVIVETVKEVDIAGSRTFTGRIEAMEKVGLRARVDGFLKPRLFEEGALVKKGDVLLEIDSSAYEVNVALAEANPANAEAGIVVAAEDPEKGYFFEPSHIVERDSAGWGRLEMAVTLPASTVGSKGRFYLWNPSSQQTVWFDDLKVYRLQAK